eukprot:c12165_g1_i1.p1 GENE.c12165_g1_i1~~c12165_g1_i1.p1  ORF type:complete len:180 (+),score=77.16 c12165_g1_i1:22-540(+)
MRSSINFARRFTTQQPISTFATQSLFTSSTRFAHNVTRLNHIAIAVPNLAAATENYKKLLGCHVSEPQPEPDHGVTVVFVTLGNTKIELLEPLGENSPIAKFLEKNPSGGMHHLCVEVTDLKGSIQEMKTKKVRLLNDEPKIGAHKNPVVFIHPKDTNGVLLEFEEVPVTKQ